MTDDNKPVLDELLRVAESRVARPLWNGPSGRGDNLLATIRRLEGAAVGLDWTDAIAPDLQSVWQDLPQEAQLAAFIVAADYAFSVEGPDSLE